MTYKMVFEELNFDNIYIFQDLMIKVFGEKILNYDEYGYDVNLFSDILKGKYKLFYPLFKYYIIKINNENCGIIGYYNTILYRNDVWLGWFRVLDKYKDATSYAIQLLQNKLEKYYKNITHIRTYFSYSESKDKDIKLLNNLGFINGNKRYNHYGSNDILVLSKPINGNEYKEWTRKPIW